MPEPEWEIPDLDAAKRVINILHRWAVKDAAMLAETNARLKALEAPWWRPFTRRRRRRTVQALRS